MWSMIVSLSVLSLQMKLQQSIVELQLSPLSILLEAVLDQLQEKDQAKIFAQPVNIQEVSVKTFYAAGSSIV